MTGAPVLLERAAELAETAEWFFSVAVVSVVAFLVVVAGPLLLVASLSEYRLAWTVLRTPTTDAGEARLSPSEGYVEVRGEVRADETVETPVSRQDCVVYEYETEEYRRSGRSSSWRTVDEDTEATGFYVDDGTGRVYVDPTPALVFGGGDLRLYDEDVTRVDGGDEPPPDVARFLAEKDDLNSQDDEIDLGVVGIPKGNDRRYRESYLAPGDEVYVLGQAVRDDGTAPESVVLTDGDDTLRFVVSDRSCTRRLTLRFLAKATGELALSAVFLGVTYFLIYPYVRGWLAGVV